QEILRAADDGNDHQRRVFVRVHRACLGDRPGGQGSTRLDEHRALVPLLTLALPVIDGGDSRPDVDARGEPPVDEGAPDPLRFRPRRERGIDENRLVVFTHVGEPCARGASARDTVMAKIPRVFEKIAFVASEVAEAREALARLVGLYGNADPKTADAIVVL